MDFNSIFEELTKLYEEQELKKKQVTHEADVEESVAATALTAAAGAVGSAVGKKIGNKLSEGADEVDEAQAEAEAEDVDESVLGTALATAGAACVGAAAGQMIGNRLTEDDVMEEPDKKAVDKNAAADGYEIVDEADKELRQLILECDKCGAIMIKGEPDVVVDEVTDLVNVEDTCQFCEETAGYKIIGVVAPYETNEEVAEDNEDLEELFDVSIDASGIASGNVL